MATADQPDGAGQEASAPTASRKGSYFEELHVALVVALVVICVALGFVGWKLHPDSSGFKPVPQDVRILVAGSGYDSLEALTQSGPEGTMMTVTLSVGKTVPVPLRDSDTFGLEPSPSQAATAPPYWSGPPVLFDGKPLSSARWALIVLHPGTAQACTAHSGYRRGTVQLPLGSPTQALVVPPPRLGGTVGVSLPPPALCVHWNASGPVSLVGPYLSARFAPFRGISTALPFTDAPAPGDLSMGTVTRRLALDGDNTADFAMQSDPQPTLAAPTSWSWTSDNAPQVIQAAATNSSAVQQENNNAFYSGILFGVVGGALIALITELVVPLHRRRIARRAE
jgi:hypothetical protein